MRKILSLAACLCVVLILAGCNGLPGLKESSDSPTAPAPAPIADFSWHANGNTIVFANRSQGAERYHWRFGDGVESSDTNPTHQYSTFGNFQVRLEATNRDGATATVERSITTN